MAGSASWLVPVLAAIGGSGAGSMITSALSGRDRKRDQMRAAVRDFERRMEGLETAKAVMAQDLSAMRRELDQDTDRRRHHP